METMSVYDGFELQKKCFEALGETGKVLRDQFVPACRGLVKTLEHVDAVHKRIHEKLHHK